jgi:hypothetical protein
MVTRADADNVTRTVPVTTGVPDTEPVAVSEVNELAVTAAVRESAVVPEGEPVGRLDAEELSEPEGVSSAVTVTPDERLGTVDELTERDPVGDGLALTEAVPERVAADAVGRPLLLIEADPVALLSDDADRADDGVTAGETESFRDGDDELLRQRDALDDRDAAAEREVEGVPVDEALSETE